MIIVWVAATWAAASVATAGLWAAAAHTVKNWEL